MAGLAMTRDDIIKALDWCPRCVERDENSLLARVERVVAQAVAAEREACAKVCDKWYEVACSRESERRTHHYLMGKGARACAHAIRTRDDR